MKNKKIVITGGTGFLAQSLARIFARDNEVVLLSRLSNDHINNLYDNKLVQPGTLQVRYVQWDARNEGGWMNEIDGADLVINLAGKTVNARYHKKQKNEILNSRIHATNAIGVAIAKATIKPGVWINASSATIYRHTFDQPNGDDGLISEWKADNMPFNIIDKFRFAYKKRLASLTTGKDSDEYKSLDKDFSVHVCKSWENTFFSHATPGTRKIALRMAIVLGAGGVITPFLELCKYGLGGKHGTGNQYFSWVHEQDVASMIEWLMQWDTEGIYNCAAPNPVTNKEMMRVLRKLTGHAVGLPAPTLLLELGSILIRTETELMLKSRKVISTRAANEGFRFQFETIESALKEIIQKLPRKTYHLL